MIKDLTFREIVYQLESDDNKTEILDALQSVFLKYASAEQRQITIADAEAILVNTASVVLRVVHPEIKRLYPKLSKRQVLDVACMQTKILRSETLMTLENILERAYRLAGSNNGI